MNRAKWIAWLSCVLAMAAGVAGLILWGRSRSYLSPSAVLCTVTFHALGLLIVTHQPRNRIGWIFCAIGVLNGLWLLTSQYAIQALITDPGSLPGGASAAWLSSWIWAPPIWLTGTLCILLSQTATFRHAAGGPLCGWPSAGLSSLSAPCP